MMDETCWSLRPALVRGVQMFVSVLHAMRAASKLYPNY